VKLILVFATGRSGTAFLSQAFGGARFEKKKIHFAANSKALVTHESWSGIPVRALKEQAELSSPESADIVHNYLNKVIFETKEQYPDAEKYFVADHRVGRYCVPSLKTSSLDYQVIRVFRKHEDVADSLFNRVEKRRSDYDEDKFSRFCNAIWSNNLFQNNDKFAINKVSENKWSNMSLKDKFVWYSKEVDTQWSRVRETLPKERYFETTFNEIIKPGGLEGIAKFTGIDWSRKWAAIKANG
jgi:hypothetical protein